VDKVVERKLNRLGDKIEQLRLQVSSSLEWTIAINSGNTDALECSEAYQQLQAAIQEQSVFLKKINI
jgi:hypothetical protein